MNDLAADVQEWLKAKAQRRRVFTRGEIDALYRFIDGATIVTVAHELGCNTKTAVSMLKTLGLYERRHRGGGGTAEIPWDSPLRCSRCGILLEFADYHRDGLCDWCIEQTPAKYQSIEQAIIELDNALTIHEEAVQAVEGRG